MAHDPNAMVAGQRYGRAIKLRTDTAQPFGAPVNTRRLAVYRAIAFDVGIEDRTPVNKKAARMQDAVEFGQGAPHRRGLKMHDGI